MQLFVEWMDAQVKDAAWDASGLFLATCGRDKAVWIWEALNVDDATSATAADGVSPVDFECAAVLTGHNGDVKSLVFSPLAEPPVLLSSGYDNSIRTWSSDGMDWSAGPPLPTFHSSTVWSIAFTARGDKLASGSADCSIIVWKSEDNGASGLKWSKDRVIADAHERDVYSVDWSKATGGAVASGGNAEEEQLLLASAGADNFVRIWRGDDNNNDDDDDDSGGRQVAHYEFSRDVNCVQWHPHIAGLLAAALDDGTVSILRLVAPG